MPVPLGSRFLGSLTVLWGKLKQLWLLVLQDLTPSGLVLCLYDWVHVTVISDCTRARACTTGFT
jgi:hypothetical protein